MKKLVIKSSFFLMVFLFAWGFSYGQSEKKDIVELTLQQALDEALANNDMLRAAQQKVEGTLAVLKEAKGNFLPNVDANFSYNYLDIVPGFKREVLGNIAHDFFIFFSLQQPIFTGGKLTQNRKMAEAALESQKLSFQNDRHAARLAVTLLYYRLISLNNEIQILQENRRQLEIQAQYSRLLIQAGHMSELELGRIKVELAQIDGSILKVQNEYTTTSYDLGVIMGRLDPTVFSPTDSLKLEPLEINPEDFLPTALAHNPNLKKFEWDIKQAQSNVQLQKAMRLPQIAAQLWYGYEFGLDTFSLGKNDRYFLGLTARMPLFDGGVIKADILKAKSQLNQITEQQEYLLKTIKVQLQNLHLKLLYLIKQAEIQEQAVENAEKTYRLAIIEYHAGQRPNTDLLEIQKSLLNNRLQLNTIIVEYNKSNAELRFALGIL
ncbi:MAG: TolC family protein [Acidobacteria bacterium]|jgi:outer membrane protein|nr:TolC family protein [Acidobacteriota bacterium]